MHTLFYLFLNKIKMLGECACALHDVERKKCTDALGVVLIKYGYVYSTLQHGMLAHYVLYWLSYQIN